MVKKICNSVFIFLFLLCLSTPLILTDWSSGGVSSDENRNLSEFPRFVENGDWNGEFPKEFEGWFMDHLGLRQELISINADIQYRVFDRLINNSDYHIGPYGDLNFATEKMIKDYAHVNLRSEEEVALIGNSYQAISDWLAEQEIPFYYVQCYDKHSIYPEQFSDKINQLGSVSKTDQVISYLGNHTTVNLISLKEPLLKAKETYEVYSNWGDPTHWSPRGAYVGYSLIMERLNADFSNKFIILQETDYEITMRNAGITLNKVVHQDDIIEHFEILDPKAIKIDKSVMQKWGEDYRHSVWVNPESSNDTRLLLMCDSYIRSYIIEDFAESFSEVWLIWGDYTLDLPEVVDLCKPDIVIYECAERVDRSKEVVLLAEKLSKVKNQ